MISLIKKILYSENFVLYLSLLFIIILLPLYPRIAGFRNLSNLSSNLWPLFVLVVGQMFVLIVGGIDLSQTSVMAVTSVIGGLLLSSNLDPLLFEKTPLWHILISEEGGPLADTVLAVPIAITIMLVIGSLIGLLNGYFVSKFNMPPFMVTLVAMMFYSGLALFITKSENVRYLPEGYIILGKGGLGFISYAFIAAGIIGIISYLILTRFVLGRWLYAVGKNIRTAIISGIPTGKVIILAYTFSGFCAAVGAVLYSARLQGGRPTLGQNLLLDIIGAAVIGGISLFGGKGKVLWALYGAFFFTLLANALNMMNLSFFTINIVKGGVILLAALFDVVRIKLMARSK